MPPTASLRRSNPAFCCAHPIMFRTAAPWHLVISKTVQWMKVMANGRQSKAKRANMAERAQQMMEVHFPNVSPVFLWHRKKNDGFTTIPRTMPIIMQAIDDNSKGTPAGHTLLSLWARSPDHSVVVIENPSTFAAEAGFIGERAVDTWRKRMKKLREMWMITTKEGPSGEFHYVLLWNPNVGLEYMRMAKKVQDGVYGRFIDRLMEIGAYSDLEEFREFLKEHQEAEAQKAAATTV